MTERDVTITVETRARVSVVCIDGEVDFRSVSDLRAAMTDLLTEHHDRIVVDLSRLTWIDSIGLGVLVAAWKRARPTGAELVLWRPSPKAAAVLKIARLDRVMTVVVDDQVDPFAA